MYILFSQPDILLMLADLLLRFGVILFCFMLTSSVSCTLKMEAAVVVCGPAVFQTDQRNVLIQGLFAH